MPENTEVEVVRAHGVAIDVELQEPGVGAIYRRRPIVADEASIEGFTRAEIAVAGGRKKDLISGSFSGITIEPETLQASMIGIFTVICPLRSER